MDFENMYFHGLAGNIVVINQDKLVIDTSLTQFESIIKLGGIMSRSKLKENGVVYSWKPVYNGEDYSIKFLKKDEVKELKSILKQYDYSTDESFYAGENQVAKL